jgi:hypothetical protein
VEDLEGVEEEEEEEEERLVYCQAATLKKFESQTLSLPP